MSEKREFILKFSADNEETEISQIHTRTLTGTLEQFESSWEDLPDIEYDLNEAGIAGTMNVTGSYPDDGSPVEMHVFTCECEWENAKDAREKYEAHLQSCGLEPVGDWTVIEEPIEYIGTCDTTTAGRGILSTEALPE